MGSPLRRALQVAALAVLITGCGTSSSTSVNAPSERCAVNATAQPPAVGAPGGTGSITIATDRECAWEARSEADWLSLSATSGRGDGTLRYTAAGNSVVSERRGAVVVNGSRVEIGQAAAACQFSLSRSRDVIGAAGGRLEVSVGAQAGCEWSAQGGTPWATIASGAAGRGAGVVAIAVAANTLPAPRATTLTIAGQPYAIEQAGAVDAPVPPAPPSPNDPDCRFAVSPLTGSFGPEGGVLEVTVAASTATCTWTAASTASWIVMEGGVVGTGSGSRRFHVAANTGTTPRTGTLGVAGAGVTVTQGAATAPPNPDPTPDPDPGPPPEPQPEPPPPPPPPPCTFAVSPNPVSVGFSGNGDIDLHVVTTADCAWTAVSQSSWITINGPSTGSGDGHVHIGVASTLSIGGRVGTLTVGGQTVTVNQAGILDQEVTFSGTVTNLSGSCPNRTFSIDGAAIVTDRGTEFPGRDDCRDLRDGEPARVRGVGQANGTIRATRIDRIGRGDTADPAIDGVAEDDQ